ncbi:MAG: metal ABC transporter ATP-binding protein [Pseudomonadota bacterium]
MTPAPLELAAVDGRAAPSAAPLAPLSLRGVTVSYDDKPALVSVDADFAAGAMTAIVGPNGAGKSTLLKAALGLIPRLGGRVAAFGLPIEQARGRIAYVPQRASVDWDFPIRAVDVVLQGMTAELGWLRPVRARHQARARGHLARVGMEDFADRQIGRLSGGQQQRVFLARALAQDAELYLLDEPFAGVDAATERAILRVLKALRSEGRAVVAVHHDLATVPDHFDRALVLNVRKIAEGPVAEVFTAAALQEAYGGRLEAAQTALAAG